jgi:hypothetical protein
MYHDLDLVLSDDGIMVVECFIGDMYYDVGYRSFFRTLQGIEKLHTRLVNGWHLCDDDFWLSSGWLKMGNCHYLIIDVIPEGICWVIRMGILALHHASSLARWLLCLGSIPHDMIQQL